MTPEDLVQRLRERGSTLALAESLTGGLLADAFISIPGASAVVRGAVVAYASDLKAALLGVDGEILASRGAVDGCVAEQMASGVAQRLGATYGLATTGVAGPDPQDGKPVGTVYLGAATPLGVFHERVHLAGARNEIRMGAVAAAVDLLARHLDAGTKT